MRLDLELKQKSITVDIANVKVIATQTGETYDGDYEFTSTFTRQTYHTRDKVMTNNININIIPVYSVGNTSGGYTVTIGDA